MTSDAAGLDIDINATAGAADGTGIPVDDGLAAVSAPEREQLKLERLGGAANSKLDDVSATEFETIDALFGG